MITFLALHFLSFKTIRDISFFPCVCVCVCVGGGGCNFPAEICQKIFFPPTEYTLKIAPPPRREGYSVVSSIGYAVTVGHC